MVPEEKKSVDRRENYLPQQKPSQSQTSFKPGPPPTKPKAKSPTRSSTPPILQRQRTRDIKREEQRLAQTEAQKTLDELHAKPLDLERLKEMCQPRKVIDKEKMEIEEMKKQFKPQLTDADI
jgi:hypothetical protein